MRNYLVIGLLILIAQLGMSQGQVPIGDWANFLPINRSYAVTQSDQYVYYAISGGMLRVDKDGFSLKEIRKKEGLTDSHPGKLGYDPSSKSLLIAYTNGNLDVMDADEIRNVPNILNNSSITASKNPNRIRFDGGFAYICYDFGIVQLEMATKRFGFSLITSFEVNDFAVLGDQLFMATSQGVYRIEKNANQADITQWTHLAGEGGWPGNYESRTLLTIGGKMYVDVDGELYTYKSNNLNFFYRDSDDEYRSRSLNLLNDNSFALVTFRTTQYGRDHVFYFDKDEQLIRTLMNTCTDGFIEELVQSEDGRIFTGGTEKAVQYYEKIEENCKEITFNKPADKGGDQIFFDGDDVLVASSSLTDKLNFSFERDGIYSYSEGVWDHFNSEDEPSLGGDTILDYHRLIKSPTTGEMIIGTFYDGLIRWNRSTNEIVHIDNYNSCLKKRDLAGDRVNIGGMAYDTRGNLWVTNNRAETPLVMFDSEWNCYDFRTPSTNDLTDIVIDDSGTKWCATFDKSIGIVAFDEGVLEDDTDNEIRYITTSNSELEDNRVLSIAKDLDGDIWAGTDQGVVVFECPSSIFTNGCSGRKPIVEVQGEPAFLLANEKVRTIAIDGANRKWFGTNKGIFVLSADVTELVYEFNTKNSPLLNDIIRVIDINPENGEVWIVTADGIQLFRADATLGDEFVHQPESEVYAFPNPVRPEYRGPIAIKGLPRDARIKITDIDGKLIHETTANGGQAIWDGNNYNGDRAATGVYLVFSLSQSSFSKPDAMVTKILLVN